jgi:hypothetical protein
VSSADELVETLLHGDPAERQRLLREAHTEVLEAALPQLGHRREPAAAEVLALADLVLDNRSLKKLARRELHRLRSMGVQAPAPSLATPEPQPAEPQRPLAISEAWVTDIDPSGSRALWLLADRPLGGVWFAALLINDLQGLADLRLVDTTRKRFQRQFEENRRESIWVSLPAEYALSLVREGLDVTREHGGSVPTRYQTFRGIFGEASGPPERALIYDTISPVEVNFHPDWLEESARLLAEPELAGWYISVPGDLSARAIEVARGPHSGLLVPGHTPEQEALQLLAEAAQQALTLPVRRAFRRRLEETAFILASTDRLAAARLAVAAARPLEDERLAPESHPLLRMLLASGLARLIGTEAIGGRRAPEVLLDLVERASSQRERQGPSVETRPSGLILPR